MFRNRSRAMGWQFLSALTVLVLADCPTAFAQKESKTESDVLFESSFSADDPRWTFSDPTAWRRSEEGWLSLHQKVSSYVPSHRSPTHVALLGDVQAGNFSMDVSIRSTHADYGHRDVCLYFGYQGPDKFYYVHLGKVADEHCNQIFIVNEFDRTKISTRSNEGTPWDEEWHHVRMERDVESGEIRVYFDDMTTPTMRAVDKTFLTGQFGLGSFDDTADFDNLLIRSGIK